MNPGACKLWVYNLYSPYRGSAASPARCGACPPCSASTERSARAVRSGDAERRWRQEKALLALRTLTRPACVFFSLESFRGRTHLLGERRDAQAVESELGVERGGVKLGRAAVPRRVDVEVAEERQRLLCVSFVFRCRRESGAAIGRVLRPHALNNTRG